MKATKKGLKETGVTEAEAAAGLSALFGGQTAEERAIERIEKELAVIRHDVLKVRKAIIEIYKTETELLVRMNQLLTKKRK